MGRKVHSKDTRLVLSVKPYEPDWMDIVHNPSTVSVQGIKSSNKINNRRIQIYHNLFF